MNLIIDTFLDGSLLRVRRGSDSPDGLLIWNRPIGPGDSINRVYYSSQTELTLKVLIPAVRDERDYLDQIISKDADARKHYTDLSNTGFFRHPGNLTRLKVDVLGRLPSQLSSQQTTNKVDDWFRHFPQCGAVRMSLFSEDTEEILFTANAIANHANVVNSKVPWSLTVFSQITTLQKPERIMELLDCGNLELRWIVDLQAMESYITGIDGAVAFFEETGFLFPVTLRIPWEKLENDAQREEAVSIIMQFYKMATSRHITLSLTVPQPWQSTTVWHRWLRAVELFYRESWNAGLDATTFEPYATVLKSIIQEPVPGHIYEFDLLNGSIIPWGCEDNTYVYNNNMTPLAKLEQLNEAMKRSRLAEPCASCSLQTICPSMAPDPLALYNHAFGTVSKAFPQIFEARCGINMQIIEFVLEGIITAAAQASQVAPPLKLDITKDRDAIFSLLE